MYGIVAVLSSRNRARDDVSLSVGTGLTVSLTESPCCYLCLLLINWQLSCQESTVHQNLIFAPQK